MNGITRVWGFSHIMTVTILTPVYAVERYIAECAESLFSQTYPDIEYVFCDDCTPDGSISVLEEVIRRHPERANAVRIIRNERNSGIGLVRARLLEAVRTDCFFFADSDDLLPENAIATLVERMEATGKDIIDGAHADYMAGKVMPPQLTYHGSDEAFCRRVLCQNVEANRVWGRLYKASVLQKLPDMFFEGIDYSEDYCAVARLAALTSRAWTDEVVYLYRRDNLSSYTKNVSRKNIMSYLRANREVLRFYRQRGHLPFALEIGMLNAYRECRRAGMPPVVADAVMRYVPEHWRARLLCRLLCSSALYALGDRLYRVMRLFVVGYK